MTIMKQVLIYYLGIRGKPSGTPWREIPWIKEGNALVMAAREHFPTWIYEITSLPSAIINVFVVPMLHFFILFILLVERDADWNYSRYQARSYFLRLVSKGRKTWRGKKKCTVVQFTEWNKNNKNNKMSWPAHSSTSLFSRALLRHLSTWYWSAKHQAMLST